MIDVRPARPADVRSVAALILEPGGLRDWFPRDVALRVATAAFRSPRSALSYRRSVVAVQDGRVVASMARFPGAEWPRLRVATGAAMLRGTGVRHARALVRRGREEERATEPIASDALYVLSLAVDPDRRGRGLGARLLGLAVEEARRLGLAAVALDTASDNEGAIRFYRREGFDVHPASVGTRPGRGTARPLRAVFSIQP